VAGRMRPETAVAVRGIRGLQIAKFRSRLERLPEAGFDGVYDHSPERRRVVDRIAGLESGDDVYLQAWELADELLPVAGLKSRWDPSGPKCFRMSGDRLVPEEHQKTGAVLPDTSGDA
jgi:hypothetical protein